MTEKQCGTCSLCCKLLGIVALDKPPHVWCTHCKPGDGGCMIHANRSAECRDFYCGWLAIEGLGPEWFPARCKMMIVPMADRIIINVDPAFPGAWRREPNYSQLVRWAQRAAIEIWVGRRFIDLATGHEMDRGPPGAWR
jgi:hypothetical protein